MTKKIFFNSSLPRSGSTLLQNLVAQNPDFYCTPTSGLSDMVLSNKNAYNNSQAILAQDQETMQKAFFGYVSNGLHGYFNAITDKPYVLEKSREWGVQIDLLKMILNQEPKIVCMVRDLRSIYSSMEKNFRKNPHRENHVQKPVELVGTTLRKRIDIWASGLPVGISIDRLRDIIDQKIDQKILFIRYEDLMQNPNEEINRLYKYLEIPYYENHDFVNIQQLTHENDIIHGIYGDHVLRPKFEQKPNDFDEILGFEICRDIKNTYQWFYDYFGYV
jgi:sulfotransferase